MPESARPFHLGDRVRLNERCAWEWRVGLEGEITDPNPGYDTVYLLLDDDDSPRESQWPENGGRQVKWTCSALEDSLDLVEPVEKRLSLTAFQLKAWDELEALQGWERDGDGAGNWEPWQKSWSSARSSAEGRALGVLAAKGLVAVKFGRAHSKIPDSYRPLSWDVRQAPAAED
jgi:hypothetical protein